MIENSIVKPSDLSQKAKKHSVMPSEIGIFFVGKKMNTITLSIDPPRFFISSCVNLVGCIFQGIWLFHINFQIYRWKLVLQPSSFESLWDLYSVPFFIPDVDILCFFSWLVLCRVYQVYSFNETILTFFFFATDAYFLSHSFLFFVYIYICLYV